MRFKQILLVLVLSAAATLAHAQAEPSAQIAATIVNALAPSSAPREGFTRLRVSLTSNELTNSEVVRLAGLTVCSKSACYESGLPSSATISNTSSGAATTIAELEIPFLDITSVRFKSTAGQDVLQGSVTLTDALKLERGFRGGDVLVVVQKRGNNYIPVVAAANYFHPEGTTVFYNPKFATTAELPRGVLLSIPAGALTTPQVFVTTARDTGDEHPLVDIFPNVKLAKPAKVTMPAIARPSRAANSTQSPLPPGGTASPAQSVQPDGATIIEIQSTGVVRRGRQQAPLTSQPTSANTPSIRSDTFAAGATAITTCTGMMSNSVAEPTIATTLGNTGTIYLDWCETIAPFVHITVSNLADTRERFTIKHDNKVSANSIRRLPLQRIATWAQYTQVMLNGFTWEGDQGTFSGGFGLANGFVASYGYASDSNVLGINRVGGGTCEDFFTDSNCPFTSQSAGNKVIMITQQSGPNVTWVENSALVIYGGTTYVSSSTSILKDGVCTTGPESSRVSRWSVVGTTPGGRMIMMSSTSGGTTSGAELCPVLQAMGVTYAMRLDGGPSAAMTIDGILKNPLTGLYFLKYGDMRYIPYTLSVAYPGASRTPAPALGGGRVITPINPCLINPRSCR